MIGRLKDKLLDFFLVRPEELGLLALLGANTFFGINTLVVSQIVGETLFLSAFDRGTLVYMYAATGLSAAAAGLIYAKLQKRIRSGHFEIYTIIFFICCYSAIWILTSVGFRWVYAGMLVFSEVFATLIVIQAWNISAALLPQRAAKRLIPIIGSCGTLAGITAGFSISVFAESLGTNNLIAIILLHLSAALIICVILMRKIAANNVVADREMRAGNTTRKQRKTPGSALFSNRFFLILLGITTMAALSSIMVDYQFKVFTQAYFTTDGVLRTDDLSEFYGLFQIFITICALIVQFGFASRVLEWYGVAVALVLLPLVIVTGTIGIILGIGSYFAAASFARAGDKILRFGIFGSTNQILYLALPDRLQKDARSMINGVLRPLTIIIASAILVFLTRVAELPDQQVGYVTVALGFVWIILSVTAGRQYLAQLIMTIGRNRLYFAKGKTIIKDRAAVEEIISSLSSTKEAQIREALTLADRVQGHDLCADVEHLLSHSSAAIRAKAITYLSAHNDISSVETIRELVADKDATVRAQAIKALGMLAPKGRVSEIAHYLKHDDLSIRLAAITTMISRAGKTHAGNASKALDTILRSRVKDTKISAIRSLPDLPKDIAVKKLIPFLSHSDEVIRGAALRASVEINHPELRKVLIENLKNGIVQIGMVEALSEASGKAVGQLSSILLDEHQPDLIRARAARILGNVATDEALTALLEHINNFDRRFPTEAAKAAALIIGHNKTLISRAEISTVLEKTYRRIFQVIAWRADLQNIKQDGNLDLLEAIFADEQNRHTNYLFILLRLIYASRSIDLAQRNLYSSSPKQQGLALEVLSQILGREDKNLIMPLFESASPEEILEATEKFLPVERNKAQAWLNEWLGAQDPWLRAGALWVLPTSKDSEIDGIVSDQLTADHALVRETAAVILARAGKLENNRGKIEKLLKDPDHLVRLQVAELLG